MATSRKAIEIFSLAAIVAIGALVLNIGMVSATDRYVGPGEIYTTIQAAVAAANPGDTIIVRDEMYIENVNVNLRLTIRSENGSANCIVQAADPNDYVFEITADWVNLSGLTVQNSTGHWKAGIYLGSGVDHCTISNNTLSGNYFGIYVASSSYNILKDNIVRYNTQYGIEFEASDYNLISGNQVHNSWVGLSFISGNDHNNISNNNIHDNVGAGIDFRADGNNNTIIGNHVYNNSDGISLMDVTTSTVTGNYVYNNTRIGIYLWLFGTSDDVISGNSVYINPTGIILRNSSSNVNCSRNDIYSNGYGIRVEESNNSIVVFNNNLTNNIYGVLLWFNSSNNRIYNNYFHNTVNAYDAGNNRWNITKTAGTNIIAGSWLGGNYWSDYKGEDTNGDGLGDTQLPYNASGNIVTGGDWLPLVKAEELIFDTGEGSYPSISGTFTGTITPSRNLTLNTLYTYSCTGTGGHTKSIELYEYSFLRGTGMWSGYQSDWRTITFTKVALLKDHEYRYIIVTGAYPQVVHAESKDVTGGTITYTDFVDINGKQHENWMPAIKLYFLKTSVDDLTFEEARAIALNSTCVQEGTLTDTCIYNEYSHTWWFGLEPFTENLNCNPACVVSEDTGTAEINWRCTMATP